jgi:ELWxxDGT repeat protein
MRSWCLAALLGVCAAPAGSATGPAHLVADLNPGTAPWDSNYTSIFQSFSRLGARTLFLGFFANDVQCGLWATDGTAAGTSRLADLCGESLSFTDAYQVQILGVAGSLALLTDSLARLWRTDGTAAGTFPLGATVSIYNGQPVMGPGGILYFVACSAARNCQPWRSDGTVAGTRLLLAIENDPGISASFQFIVQGGHVVFSGIDVQGAVLWITDGTQAGTRELARFPSQIGYLLAADDSLYVSAGSDLWHVSAKGHVARLGSFPMDWRSPGVYLFQAGGRVLFEDDEGDGTVSLWEIPAFQHRVRFIARFGNGMGPVVEVGGRLVFAAAKDYGTASFSLWVLGPKMSRPHLLRHCPEGCPGVDGNSLQLGGLGNRAVFAGRDHRGSELWETDGTGPGTRLLKDLCPGECDGFPLDFSPALGRLLFTAGDRDLWVTDGTSAGTTRLGRIVSGLVDRLDFAEMRGRVVFNGLDAAQGSQPWLSDLTGAGTERLLDLGGGLAAGAAIESLTPFGSGVLFSACGPGGRGLWGSDGTAAGTALLPVDRKACDFFFGPLVTAGDLAFFSPDLAELWRTDGTPQGTLFLTSWSPSRLTSFFPLDSGLVAVLDPANPQPPWALDFWRSDGTAAGTRLSGSVGLGGGFIAVGAAGNNAFFFAAHKEPPFSSALWRTDGTVAGTRPLLDLDSEPFPEEQLVALDGRAVLVLQRAFRPTGAELWVTDGTVAGTVPAIADPSAPRPLNPRGLAVFRGSVYFFADTGDPGRPLSLWRSDGTAAGTFLVADFAPPSDPAAFFSLALTPAGDFLFFALDDGVHGEELWRSDGTAAGTVMVKDIAPGPAHARPESLTAAGGRLYFTATDGEHGLELWTSDGTAAGTAMVQDILPGPVSSWPQDLVATDGNLFFTAFDGEHGRELWVLPLEPQP